MTPEQREIEKLELAMFEHPEQAQMVYKLIAEVLYATVDELRSAGAELITGRNLLDILEIIAYDWDQVSAL